MTFFNSEELAEQVESFGGDSLGEYPEYLGAIVAIRKAAALANARLGYLSDEKSKALVASCDYILEHLSEHVFNQTMMRFVGKPANRMVDQKIAEIASEVYGVTLTQEEISLNQYTTDVTTTAEGNAVNKAIDTLVQSVNILGTELARKGDEFKDVVKCGRLGLKDSLPVRLGEEFAAHHKILVLVSSELKEEQKFWQFSLLGAGDLGTGIGVLPQFGESAAEILSKEFGYTLRYEPQDFLVQMNNQYRFVIAHAKIQAAATALWKVARDLTVLASGPRAGIREIVLPAVAPGSSIMPGKINPTVAELLMHICDKVFANAAGLNVGVHSGWLGAGSTSSLPLKTILNSCQLLGRACCVIAEKVVHGVTANADRCREQAEMSLAFESLLRRVVTPEIVEAVMKRAISEGITVRAAFEKEVGEIREKSLITELFDVDLISSREGSSIFMEKLSRAIR